MKFVGVLGTRRCGTKPSSGENSGHAVDQTMNFIVGSKKPIRFRCGTEYFGAKGA